MILTENCMQEGILRCMKLQSCVLSPEQMNLVNEFFLVGIYCFRELSDVEWDEMLFNLCFMDVLRACLVVKPLAFSAQHWDLLQCAISSWVISLDKTFALASSAEGSLSIPLALFLKSTCHITVSLASFMAHLEAESEVIGKEVPSNLLSEYKEFFSPQIFRVLLHLFHITGGTFRENCDVEPWICLGVLEPLSQVVCQMPKELALSHGLPPRLSSSGRAVLSDHLASLLNHMSVLLTSSHRCLQLAAFSVIHR
ncbi:unnamed protein product [Darwinula stevensoni]|uniref:Uncharacterized protein n=1 Tax=Darwinula stevensoni TaxID=69355 RepID=A0A7R9FTU0_9CRUS|nr:unnamed protein product [Darwinula stevensoni]CAG0906067.1 unnamed protein product [Darwinula stevensoni]